MLIAFFLFILFSFLATLPRDEKELKCNFIWFYNINTVNTHAKRNWFIKSWNYFLIISFYSIFIFWQSIFLFFQISKACHDSDCHSSEVIFRFVANVHFDNVPKFHGLFKFQNMFWLFLCVVCCMMILNIIFFFALNVPWEYLKYQRNHQKNIFKLFHWALQMLFGSLIWRSNVPWNFGQNFKRFI